MAVIEEIKSLAEVPIGKSLLMMITYCASLLLIVPFSFSAFADAVKAQFNMTQTQATITEATLTTSAMFLSPAGFIYNSCSILNTSLVFLSLTTLGWTSVWLCVVARNHLIGYTGVVSIAMAIAGHAQAYVSVLSNVYVKTLIDPKYHRIYLVSIDLTGQLGIFFTSLIYESFFINGHVVDAENQSLESFLFLVLITGTIVGCLWAAAIPLTQQYQNGHPEGEEKPTSTKFRETSEKLTKTTDKKTPTPATSPSSSRFSLPFLFILSSTAIPTAILYFQSFNVSYMTRSLSIAYINYPLVSAHRICTFIGKLLLYLVIFLGGKHTYINEIVSIVFTVLLVIFQLLYLVKGTDWIFFAVSYIMCCILLGGFKLHLTLLLNTYYGTDNFGFKYSFAWSFVCVLLAVLQISFGGLYDSEIPLEGGQYCYGSICLTNTFILTASCAAIAPISSVALFYMKYQTNDEC